ncbi:MAG TPA: squalene--hopene cyclase, partial [Armatimonadota bacterium]
MFEELGGRQGHAGTSEQVADWSVEQRVPQAVASARAHLLSLQRPDGHWVGELEGDTILESDYAILLAFLGRLDSPKLPLLAEHLERKQLPEGGWSCFPGGPADISGSVKAYLALKMAGLPVDDPAMVRARDAILALGGVTKCNTFTKIYLALLGQYSWDGCPAVPPEIILAPKGCYFNVYEISSWSRTIVIPLSIIWAHRPVHPLPEGMGIDELFVGGRENAKLRLPWGAPAVSWRNFFLVVDRVLKGIEKHGLNPLRRDALKKAEAWMLERFQRSDGLGAIFPPMVNCVVAMKCLEYADDHPQVLWAMDELEKLEILEDGALRLQPCFSPVWDTAVATIALNEAGLTYEDEPLKLGLDWLLSKEVTGPGDWQMKAPGAKPAGWFFEYANEFYPDVDDTAMVVMALRRGLAEGSPGWEAASRGIEWVMSMRCKDGGWASFDKDNDRMVFTHVPFADHNAMLDPSTADITARVLEMLGHFGSRAEEPEIQS